MRHFGLINSALCVFLLAGCGTKYEDCGEGLARADDGNCYQYRFSDTGGSSGLPGGSGSDLDDPPVDADGGTDADGIDADGGDPTGGDVGGGDVGGGDVGGGDVGGGDVGGGDVGGGDVGGGDVGGGDVGGGDVGGGDVGGGDVGGGDVGGGDVGGGDVGGGDVGGGDVGGGDGGGITECTSDADCELEDCISDSVGCACLDAIGECVPTCESVDDCPEGEDFICASGFCEPAGGGVDVSPPDEF
jgi:hypothetical protein